MKESLLKATIFSVDAWLIYSVKGETRNRRLNGHLYLGLGGYNNPGRRDETAHNVRATRIKKDSIL